MTEPWANARAQQLSADLSGYRSVAQIHNTIAAALQEAIERGKAEQDKAVASRSFVDGAKTAEAALIARLENPDEAMVEAVARQFSSGPRNRWDADAPAKAIIAALARTLTEGQENSDGH